MIEKRVAKITKTFLGYEDHGIFTFALTLDYGGSGQGAGHIVLGDEHTDRFIKGVLSACGVDSWEQIPGRTLYAYADHGKVYALEPLPTEPGERFALDDTFTQWKSAA